jgi:hypothetical protein
MPVWTPNACKPRSATGDHHFYSAYSSGTVDYPFATARNSPTSAHPVSYPHEYGYTPLSEFLSNYHHITSAAIPEYRRELSTVRWRLVSVGLHVSMSCLRKMMATVDLICKVFLYWTYTIGNPANYKLQRASAGPRTTREIGRFLSWNKMNSQSFSFAMVASRNQLKSYSSSRSWWHRFTYDYAIFSLTIRQCIFDSFHWSRSILSF